MRLLRTSLVWFLVYSMVALPVGARMSTHSGGRAFRPHDGGEASAQGETGANPRCVADVENAAGSLASCLLEEIASDSDSDSDSDSKSNRQHRRASRSGNDSGFESPLGRCGDRFERRIERANEKFDRCTEVTPSRIQGDVYQYSQQAAWMARGAGGQISFYALDAEVIEASHYGSVGDSPATESIVGDLVLSGIDTSSVIMVNDRPARGTKTLTWGEFVDDWASRGTASPINALIAGAFERDGGGYGRCVVEMAFDSAPTPAGEDSAGWTGHLVEWGDRCPETTNIRFEYASVIIGPAILGGYGEDLSDRCVAKFQQASGERAQCHLRAEARAARRGSERGLERGKARCERRFDRQLARAKRKYGPDKCSAVSDEISDHSIETFVTAVTDAARGVRTISWTYGVGAGLATLSGGDTLLLAEINATGLTSFSSDPDFGHQEISWKEFRQSWNHGPDSFANDPPNAILGGNYLDDSGQIHHCSMTLELLAPPEIGSEGVAWEATVLAKAAECPEEISLVDAFLFVDSQKTLTDQIASNDSSPGASSDSPYPVEVGKGVYTAEVTAVIPVSCSDPDYGLYRDQTSTKQVRLTLNNHTNEDLLLQSWHFAGGIDPLDGSPFHDVKKQTGKNRFGFQYINNEEGDCEGKNRHSSFGDSYVEYSIGGSTPFVINLEAAQPQPLPTIGFWEGLKDWFRNVPWWEWVLYAVMAIIIIALIPYTGGESAEVGVDLAEALEESVVIDEVTGETEFFSQALLDTDPMFDDAILNEQAMNEYESLNESGQYVGPERLVQFLKYNGFDASTSVGEEVQILDYQTEVMYISPESAPDMTFDGLNWGGNEFYVQEPGKFDGFLDTSGIHELESFESEAQELNLEAQNATLSNSGVGVQTSRSVWPIVTQVGALAVTAVTGNKQWGWWNTKSYINGRPRMDVVTNPSDQWFMRASVNGPQAEVLEGYDDNTQYVIKLDDKYLITVQSGASEFTGFRKNKYLPVPGASNHLTVSVYPISAAGGLNDDGLARIHRALGALYVPASNATCAAAADGGVCGLAIDRSGVVRDIQIAMEEGVPWSYTVVTDLAGPVSAYAVDPDLDSDGRQNIYVAMSDGRIVRLERAGDGTTSWTALGSPQDLGGDSCAGPGAEGTGCYWLSNESGCWDKQGTTTEEACNDQDECDSGGGCYSWVTDSAPVAIHLPQYNSKFMYVALADGRIMVNSDPESLPNAEWRQLSVWDDSYQIRGLATTPPEPSEAAACTPRDASQVSASCYLRVRSWDPTKPCWWQGDPAGPNSSWYGDLTEEQCEILNDHSGCAPGECNQWFADPLRSFNPQAELLVTTMDGAIIRGVDRSQQTGDYGDFKTHRSGSGGEALDAAVFGGNYLFSSYSSQEEFDYNCLVGSWFCHTGDTTYFNIDASPIVEVPPAGGCTEGPGANGTGCYWLNPEGWCWEPRNQPSTEQACNAKDSCDTGGGCYSWATETESCTMVRQEILSTSSKPKMNAYDKYLFIATEEEGEDAYGNSITNYDIKRFDSDAPCDETLVKSYAEEFSSLETSPVTTSISTSGGLWFGLKNGDVFHYDLDDEMKKLGSGTAIYSCEPGVEGTGCYWQGTGDTCWFTHNASQGDAVTPTTCRDDFANDPDRISLYVWGFNMAVQDILPGVNDLSAIVTIKDPRSRQRRRVLTCDDGHVNCRWISAYN